MNEWVKVKRNLEQELESKMKEVKGLKAQIDKKKVLKGKVDVKKGQIEAFKKDSKPKDLAKERDNLEKKKLKLIAEDVELASKLTKNLTEARNVRQRIGKRKF